MKPNKLYLTHRWALLRKRVLAEQPVCQACLMARSLHVDHIKAHKGIEALFWDRENLWALCPSCHSSKTAKRDGGWGRKPGDRPLKGTAQDGLPTDPEHPWNRRR